MRMGMGLLEQAKGTEFFTAPRLEHDLEVFLGEKGELVRSLAADSRRKGVRDVYFVASGASWAAMYPGMYLMQRFSALPAYAITGYELVGRDPVALGPNSVVILSSYSGGTEDTLAACRHAKARGARTIAIVKRRPNGSQLAGLADEVIDYDSAALFHLPMAAASLFALELALKNSPHHKEIAETLDGLQALPRLLGDVYRRSEEEARDYANVLSDSKSIYVIGSGPLYGVAYTYALTVFMEYLRIHASVIETSEFRQGPVEVLASQKADFVFLVGNDQSRSMSLRVLETVAQQQNVRCAVFDLASYPDIHPLLAAFALHIPLQWFTVYSAPPRGLGNIDERVFMGRGLLAREGATWP